ncbi:MAG: M12 family metallo-peptidase, partial [Pseudomonadota bacterium]|nr:M12 family metallo-peptidase [Pseudomonadota bacterium]
NYPTGLPIRNTLTFWLMVLSIGLTSITTTLWAQQKTPQLFTPSFIEKDNASQNPTIIRSQFVHANLNALTDLIDRYEFNTIEEEAADKQQSIKMGLTLFRDVALVAELDYIEETSDTDSAYIGHIVGYENNSEVVLIKKGNTLIGNISLSDSFYEIRSVGNDISVIHQIDQSQFPTEKFLPVLLPDEQVDTIASTDNSSITQLDNPTAADDGSIIDVMVVYTAAAQNGEGGENNIKALIDLAITETNTGYFNAQVNQRLNLVHAQKITYSESGFDWFTALERLRGKSDGHMDNVHSLRDTHKADVVVLLVNDFRYCGLAYLMSTESASFESSAFSVVNTSCATGYYSFGHELGHLMGSHHDRGSAYSSGAFPYSHGYQAPNETFRTVMAYNCSSGCKRVNYWSNPNVTYNNIPTGVSETKSNSAFNAKSLNNTADTVANFRQSNDDENISFSCNQVNELPKTECQALVALYDSTQGDSWSKKTGWLNTTTPCSQPWSGVTCRNGHVVKLSLRSNNLNGSLPTELGNLSYLTHLLLNNNQLTGALPAALGQLGKLKNLYLYNNSLTGTLPTQLGNLTQLKKFYFHNNAVGGQIPSQLGNLEQLSVLYLSNNQFEGQVPATLGNLSYLVAFKIEGNSQLQGALPLELTHLSQLNRFHFNKTDTCEPQDKTFQVWLAGIDALRSTNVMCAN